ncbi:tetraacyldisaccharide 4'-kinase [Paraglaciecola sp.]|uniref:tetraacyldisaccharide 4'-kinase n=1 Tax=Paraglaciecola sp. TaxID=1920173 RepID=UPI003EF2BFA0
MKWIDKMWYSPSWFHWSIIVLLMPFTFIFWLLSSLRRTLFALKIKPSTRVPVPVIVVGNISVGGNGKTPLVVYLANRLKQEGYRPGVLSRGYGGKNASYPVSVDANSPANVVGDEAVLMRQNINSPLVVDPIRSRGAKELVGSHNCNVIICDDGLQHYALQRDIEIVVVDGKRGSGTGLLLPSGPLREGNWRLEKADFVVLNGGTVTNGEHLMSLESGRLINVKHRNKSMSIHDIKTPVVAAAGIGNPQRFFDLLKSKQVKLKACLNFIDHHQFTEKDLPQETVLMTEKDAVKCTSFAHDDWWYLPVNAKLTQQFESQFLQLLKTVVANSKNKSRE